MADIFVPCLKANNLPPFCKSNCFGFKAVLIVSRMLSTVVVPVIFMCCLVKRIKSAPTMLNRRAC